MLVEPLELDDDDDVGASIGLVEVVTGVGAGSVAVPPVDPPSGGDPPLTAVAAPQEEGA